MCFSATASFTVAGGLSIISLLSISSVTNKKQYLFALIPLFFALQQASEGIVWLSIYNSVSQAIGEYAKLIFLFFAFSFWPTWIPLSLFYLEKDSNRQRLLRFLVITGGLVSVYALYLLWLFPTTVHVCNTNLLYTVSSHQMLRMSLYLFIYCIPTAVPFFISSFRLAYIFGLIIIGTLFLTYMQWYMALISVWCFFAAVLSFLIFLSLRINRHNL